MKIYALDTEFSFGKYVGKTVKEVLELQPSYIDWCAINLDHFYISDGTITEIKNIKPEFTISEEGKQKLTDKFSIWENEQQQNDYDDYDDYDRRESYGQYAGSYAQDVEGLSDDFINDVLDGDPNAYWNID